MNLAKIMIPKVSTVFLKENQTVRQGWEIMNRNGYTAIPVLDVEGRYTGTVSEGDFLMFIMSAGTTDIQHMENHRVSELVRRDFCPPLEIQATSEQVIDSILNQNFVPIVDSRNALCGILTPRALQRIGLRRCHHPPQGLGISAKLRGPKAPRAQGAAASGADAFRRS